MLELELNFIVFFFVVCFLKEYEKFRMYVSIVEIGIENRLVVIDNFKKRFLVKR